METSLVVQQRSRFLRPAYAIAFLVLLVAFNVLSLLNQNNNSEENAISNPENETVQTIASAYNFDDSFSYDINQ